MTILFLLGIALLYAGSEALLKGSSSLAQRLKISPLIIGLTVVAFSTSSPELSVAIKATISGHWNISTGDILGSCIFNVAAILAFCALIKPIPLPLQLVKFDIPIAIFAYILLTFFILILQQIPRWGGALLVFCLIAYTISLYRLQKRTKLIAESEVIAEGGKPLKNIYFDLLFILGGLAALIYGARLFVTAAVTLAKLLGTNEETIGVGIVALGTSLPEVSCAIIALVRKKYQILVGSVIGSNIFNIFSVLGVAAIIRPFQNLEVHYSDLIMLFGSLIVILPILQKTAVIPRLKGGILFGGYLLYLYQIFTR